MRMPPKAKDNPRRVKSAGEPRLEISEGAGEFMAGHDLVFKPCAAALPAGGAVSGLILGESGDLSGIEGTLKPKGGGKGNLFGRRKVGGYEQAADLGAKG